MRHDKRYENLDALKDYKLEHESQDIRGLPLVDANGNRFGIIKDLLVGKNHDRVEAVRLEDGRTTAVEPLEIHDNAVVYGAAAKQHTETGVKEGHVVEEEVVPVVEERVVVGKRMADHGRDIRVSTSVVTDKVVEDVTLRDETVSVEKRPVNRSVSGKEADALLDGKTVRMTEHDEEAVVGKDAVVTDEVVVRKTADDRVERVEETVRKTKVDVDDTKGRRRD